MKTTIMYSNKIARIMTISAVTMGGAAIRTAALAQAPLSQTRPAPQAATKNPLSPEVAKRLSARANRLDQMEREARLLIKQRRFAEAETKAHRLLNMSLVFNGQPDQRQALQLLGDISFAQGHYRQAIGRYMRAAKHLGNFKRDCYLALCYVHLGDLNNARRFYSQQKRFGGLSQPRKTELLSQLPDNGDLKSFEAQIYFGLASDEESHASDDEAAYYYQKGLHLSPRNGLFAYELAENLMRLKRYDEALPLWARAARFGQGETALDAKRRMNNNYSPTVREKAMHDVNQLK